MDYDSLRSIVLRVLAGELCPEPAYAELLLAQCCARKEIRAVQHLHGVLLTMGVVTADLSLHDRGCHAFIVNDSMLPREACF